MLEHKHVKWVSCPKCGCDTCNQDEWEDDCIGGQHEINRSEKWQCCDCRHIFFIHAHYNMNWYSVHDANEVDDVCYDYADYDNYGINVTEGDP